MELRVDHPNFRNTALTVMHYNIWGTPKLLVNDDMQVKEGKYYKVNGDDGTTHSVKVIDRIHDPAPIVEIDGEKILLLPPLQIWEYVWAGVPLILIPLGGFIGALVGAVAAYQNAYFVRFEENTGTKIFKTALVTVGAFVVYFVLAMLVTMLIA